MALFQKKMSGKRFKTEWLLDLLYPAKCPFCGKLLEKELFLCPDCQRELPWLTGAAGEKRVELTQGCVSALAYRGKVPDAVRGYKFAGRRGARRCFGTLIAQCVSDHGLTADLVSWPSLSKKRLRRRGYDQAQLLALTVGERLGIPVARTLEKEDRPAQSSLTDKDLRRANLLGAYRARDPEAFRGKRVLLVDDVTTTGATLSECAKTLLLAGAAEVVCATLARAGG